jgi:energy-coupling factor transporter ATP-binding protein EcfA2
MSAAIPEQVYPGLRPFRRDESILFFGRQEHVDELLGRLEETSFLAVVGLSGSGKSSLVLAGLGPALERGHLSGAGPLWEIVEMRPGSDPLGELAAALDRALGEWPGRAQRLRSGRLGLVDAASGGRKPGANLLLVVDQFEELFRFQRDFENKSHEAAEFVRLLLAASNDYDARLYVVITMRSDYLGECARFPGLAEALNGSQYLTPRLTRERLREAMAGPAALRHVTVDPEWLESALDHTSENRDQLPVLQHLMRQMWNREDRGEAMGEAGFQAAGGLQALNAHADAVYRTAGNQELTRRVFQCLTESAEPGRENRRPRTAQELVEETGSDFAAVKAVVDHFREEGCNFLSPPADQPLEPASAVDITHEALIRGWAQLKEWAQQDVHAGEWYRRVEDRLRTSEGKVYLEGPELEAAIQARERGGWNPAWAKRYAGKEPKEYGDVVRWLEDSRHEGARRTRRRVWTLTGVAAALAVVAAGASWAAWEIHQERAGGAGGPAGAGARVERERRDLEERRSRAGAVLWPAGHHDGSPVAGTGVGPGNGAVESPELRAPAGPYRPGEPRGLEPGWEDPGIGGRRQRDPAVGGDRRPTPAHPAGPHGKCEQRGLEPGWEDPGIDGFRQHDPAVGCGRRGGPAHATRPYKQCEQRGLEPGWEDPGIGGL